MQCALLGKAEGRSRLLKCTVSRFSLPSFETYTADHSGKPSLPTQELLALLHTHAKGVTCCEVCGREGLAVVAGDEGEEAQGLAALVSAEADILRPALGFQLGVADRSLTLSSCQLQCGLCRAASNPRALVGVSDDNAFKH